MGTKWIKIEDLTVDLEVIPGLLDRYNILPNFLRRLLETKNTNHLKPKRDEQLKFFNEFLNENNINTQELLDKWLSLNGLDEKRLNLMLYERLQVELFKKSLFESKIENIFMDRKELLDRVMYSIMRVATKEEAVELYTQLEENESSFSELASKYALGSEKNFNGIIGPVEYGALNVNLRERLKVSTEGQLWPPYEFNNFWIILRHEKNLPAKLDDSMRTNIRNNLYEEWINKQVLSLLDQLRNKKTEESKLLTIKEQPIQVSNEINLPTAENT